MAKNSTNAKILGSDHKKTLVIVSLSALFSHSSPSKNSDCKKTGSFGF